MTDKDKMAKYRTEIQQVGALFSPDTFPTIPLFFPSRRKRRACGNFMVSMDVYLAITRCTCPW